MKPVYPFGSTPIGWKDADTRTVKYADGKVYEPQSLEIRVLRLCAERRISPSEARYIIEKGDLPEDLAEVEPWT